MAGATTMAPGPTATITAEWTKLRSVRSTWVTMALAGVIGVGFSVLATASVAATISGMSAGERANFDSGAVTMVGVNLGLILFVVMGALAASAEYSSGMMRLTLTITPNRARVLVAKALVVAIPSYIFGVLFAMVTFLSGQAIVRGADPALAIGLGDPGVLSATTNWGTETAAFALIALSLGVLLRSAAGAIATAIVIIFAPVFLGQLLPQWVQHNILAYLPASAAGNMTATRPDPTSVTYLDPQVASWVVVAWVVAFLVLAYTVMNKRDSG